MPINALKRELEAANAGLQTRTDELISGDLMGVQYLCVIALTTKLIKEIEDAD